MKLKYLKADKANFGYNACHIEAPHLSIFLNSSFTKNRLNTNTKLTKY